MKKITSYSRDFLLVVAGQIISLFGNQILVFILPLYLLNQTHSAVLFGFISAAAFLPLVVLCPIGGIMADRLNKRNIMVFLDFSTSLITLLLALLLGRLDLSLLVLIALVLFYAIQGTYQPAVTSSIPALVPEENLVQANAAITLVNAMAGLLGPIIGGSLYAFFGIYPILIIGIICFFCFCSHGTFYSYSLCPQGKSGKYFPYRLWRFERKLLFYPKKTTNHLESFPDCCPD